MATLKQALEELTTTYQDLDAVARSMAVSPSDIAKALAKTDADTAEGVALRVLAKYNPVVSTKTEDAP